MHRETINEHIRNGLSPIQCLVDFLKSYRDEEDQRELKLEFVLERLDSYQKAIDRLCLLGKNAYEEDENLWRMSYYIDQMA